MSCIHVFANKWMGCSLDGEREKEIRIKGWRPGEDEEAGRAVSARKDKGNDRTEYTEQEIVRRLSAE
jgi:hypothetical protein